MTQTGTNQTAIILTENPNFRFSASSINLYLRCPRKFYYSRLLGFSTPDHPAAAFGRYLHRLLEELHAWAFKLPQRPAMETALARLPQIESQVWPDFAEKLGPPAQAEAQRSRAAHILKEYVRQEFCRNNPPSSTLYEEEMVQPFRLGPYPITGRVDRIDLFPDGCAEIIDYKTGRNHDRANAIIKEFLNLENKPNWRPRDYQLPLYYFYWQQRQGRPPRALGHYHLRDDKGVQLVRIEVRPGVVPAAEQGKGRRTVLYESDMEQVRQELLALLDEMNRQNEDFPPRPAEGLRECERCPFRFACEGPAALESEAAE